MQSPQFFSDIPLIIWKYRVHLFVFFLALFIGLTLAHPAVLLNDEFITTNQLRQLHEGHQIIINEGKYGLAENGSMSGYFGYKSNILAYSLFLPMISLPAFWVIDITGEQFAYLILVLWMITALVLLLFINHFFPKFSYVGGWQWTSIMAVVIFLVFFINLYYYSPFSIDPVVNYPEILAIVFTNIILLAVSAMLMYEINRTIFEDPAFSFFGTMVCLFSSSYFLWSTFCKDHILVLACFVPIVLCLVRFIKTGEYWYLPLAFLFSGLLAWARPEIALWVFILTCGICGYTFIRYRRQDRPGYHPLAVLCSPLFTLIGALPFFLNNLLITKNIFLPVMSLYLHDASTPLAMNSSQSLMHSTGVTSLQSVITMSLPAIPSSPLATLTDLAGIFFYPRNGSISVFGLVPLFLLAIILVGILLARKKIPFDSEEKRFMGLSLLISLTVFLAYAFEIHSLNTSSGIAPDIRYLSPLYFPLTIVGLLILKKVNVFPENPVDMIKKLLVVGIIGLPFSLILLTLAYAPAAISSTIKFPLGNFFSLYAIALVIITVSVFLSEKILNIGKMAYQYLLLLLCTVPFFWQVNSIFIFRSFSIYAGYIFWIPAMRVIWDVITGILIFKGTIF